MRCGVVFFSTVGLAVLVVSGGPAWKDRNVQRGSGLKVGVGAGKNATSSRGNGIRIGGTSSGRVVRISTTTTLPEEEDHIQSPITPPTTSSRLVLNVGMVVPHKAFGTREYRKAVSNAEASLSRKLDVFKKYDLQVQTVMKELTPSPTGKLLYLLFYLFIPLNIELEKLSELFVFIRRSYKFSLRDKKEFKLYFPLATDGILFLLKFAADHSPMRSGLSNIKGF